MSTIKTNAVQIGQSVTTTNNFTLYQPTVPDGTVRLGNGNAGAVTDAITLSSAGSVGIGTTAPSGVLHIKAASAVLRIGTTGNLTTGSSAYINFNADAGTADAAYLGFGGTANTFDVWNRLNGPLTFATNNTEKLRIDASGHVTPGVTNTQTLGAVGDVWSNVYATTHTGALVGNASTATTFSTDRTNYLSVTNAAVAGQLMWKHYGNNHTIFDASNSTSPQGTAVNNTTAAVAWVATYPTLMGWNGTNTYGVRVDACRVADSLSTASGSAPSYSARAWVNFSGSGTVTIRANGNVTSITDVGVGLYTVNFTTAMADASYAALGNYNSANSGVGTANDGQASCYGHATGSVGVLTSNGGGTLIDPVYISVQIFR